MTTKNRLFSGILLSFLFVQTAFGLSFKGVNAIPANPNALEPGYFVYEARPGTVITDAVRVQNTNTTPLDIRVYAVETEINNQQNEVLKPHSGTKDHLASWVKFPQGEEESFQIAAGENREIGFSIVIPETAEKKSYKGGIMVEILNSENKEVAESMSIKTNARLGIRTSLLVTDTPQEIAKLSDLKPATPWQTYYLYGSAGLFAIILIVMIVQLQSHKSRKKHAAKK